MNKILAQMMLNCKEIIKPEQVAFLQTFKGNVESLDSTKAEYAALLDFDLKRFEVDPSLTAEQQTGPIELTRQESMMQTIVEVSQSKTDPYYTCYLGFL